MTKEPLFELLDKLMDGVAIVDDAGKMHYLNDAFFNIFDLPVGKTRKTKSISDLFIFDNAEFDFPNIIRQIDLPSRYIETSFNTKYGKQGIIQIGLQSLPDTGDGRRLLLLFHDVSLESRLQAKYQAELQQKDKKIHEVSLLRDVAVLLVGLTDEDSIISRILEKWMTVGNCDAAIFIKSKHERQVRRIFFIDRFENREGRFSDVSLTDRLEPLLMQQAANAELTELSRPLRDELLQHFNLEKYNICIPIPVGSKGSQAGLLLLFKHASDEPKVVVEDLNLLKSVIAQMALALEGAQYFENSIVDSMTKLYNKGYFESRFSVELSRARRNGSALSLLVCDIDHFKKFNDTYGHAVGDLVLKNVAQLIRNSCRTTDVPARYGGEEFVVVLPETSVDGAIIFGERLRASIESSQAEHGGKSLKVTVSMGLATFPSHGATETEIFKRADDALYRSKGAGRNRLTVAQS